MLFIIVFKLFVSPYNDVIITIECQKELGHLYQRLFGCVQVKENGDMLNLP